VAKQIIYNLKVKGNGQFPIDMLRHDACWPHTEEDSAKICGLMNPRLRPDGICEVNLQTIQSLNWTPTSGRWKSFGWRVVGTCFKR